MIQEDLLSLNPGKGMGPCLFGMQMDDVRMVLGEPQEIITYPDEELEGDISLSYEELSTIFHFDKEYDLRLCSLECWNPALELNGQRFIDRPLAALESALAGIQPGGAPMLQNEGACGDEVVYKCDELRLMVFVDQHGIIASIVNRSLWDTKSDAPVWFSTVPRTL